SRSEYSAYLWRYRRSHLPIISKRHDLWCVTDSTILMKDWRMKIEHSTRIGAFLIVVSLIAASVEGTEVLMLPSAATNKWQLQLQQSSVPSNQWGRLKLIADNQTL